MNQDKRSIIRKRTQQLVYLELGRDNGGVMLNLTEDGCGFQAITPVNRGQTRFAFQISGGRRIAGDAEVIWVDEVGIVGGLRFLNLPLEARKQIRLWLEETNAPEEPGFEPAAAAQGDAAARRSRASGSPQSAESARTREQRQSPSASSRIGARAVEEETSAPPAWANLRAATSPMVHDERFSVPMLREDGPFLASRPKSVALWRSIAVLATATAIAVLLVAYQRDVGSSLIWLGQTLSGKTKASAVPPETKPPVESASPDGPAASPLVETSAASQKPDEVQSTKKLPESAPNAANPLNSGAPSSGAERQESVLERQVVRDKPESWDSTESIESLWGAVQGGSISAERSLAERFVRGEGVIKNCEQAKVLLKAAADRGSREARLRLYELETQGCR